MIKFFRKIRQRLLTENKFSKYLIYAIGEIILIVIGILIALQLNNWNEVQKIKVEEKKSIERLQQESEEIISYFTEIIENSNDIIKLIENSAKALKSKSLKDMDRDEFARGVIASGWFAGIAPPKNIFEELNSTGKIQNIQSESVRKSISDYYAYLEFVNSQLLFFRDQLVNPMIGAEEDFNYIYNEQSFEKISTSFNFEKLANNKIFISRLSKQLRDNIRFTEYKLDLLNYARIMSQELEKELNSKGSSS